MNVKNWGIAVCGLIIILTGCQSPPAQQAATPMGKEQIMALFSGKTFPWGDAEGGRYIPWNAVEGAIYHNANGTVAYKGTEIGAGTGKWRVSDTGQYCLIAPLIGDQEVCFDVSVKGGKIVIVEPESGLTHSLNAGVKGYALH